ncbi:MAG TPA: BatA domain-containing protein [Phycisphaerae bacterium]|nr:BatA domain-containing protein [Phycisphaerae bacterium]
MGFLNQIMLWGLLGAAVPVLIHLLNRYRYREIDWGAMELLRRAMVVRSRRVRIEDLILLILRCLAVGLLAIAMARPTLTAGGAKFFGGEARVGMVIALDGSYSMSHRPGVNSRFDAAVQKVREITRTLQPGDQLSLVLLGQRPRVLLRNVSFDEQRIDERLNSLTPLPERLNLELGLEQAATLIDEVRAPAKECYLVSDSQDLSWRQVSEKARKTMGEISAAGRLYYLNVATGTAENLAVTDFQMVSGAARAGSMARYVATVRNSGRRAARNVPVTLTVAGKTADRRVVDAVQPDQSVPVPLYAKFDTAGNVTVQVALEHDAVLVDNLRYAAADVRQQVRVLLVDGDPGRGSDEGETIYLVRALVPDPSKASQASLRLRRVAYVELPLQRLGDFDVVVLANVPDVHDAQVEALYNFVRLGGGLIVFLGDKINGRLLNTRFRVGDVPLLPAELGLPLAAARDEEVGWPVEVTDPDHPLGRMLARLPRELLAEARVRALIRCRPAERARTILSAAGADEPLLIEGTLGRGRVVLYTSSADRDWGSVAINPAYLILLHEAIGHLTRRSHERQFTVGEPLAVAVPPQVEARQFTLTSPEGDSSPIQATEADGQRVAHCGLPDAPGFYRLQYDLKADPLMMAVNVDPTESDVRTLPPDSLSEAFASLPMTVLGGGDVFAEVKQARRGLELWRTFMLAALIVLLLEALLAKVFTSRMAAEESVLPRSARQTVLGTQEAA